MEEELEGLKEEGRGERRKRRVEGDAEERDGEESVGRRGVERRGEEEEMGIGRAEEERGIGGERRRRTGGSDLGELRRIGVGRRGCGGGGR